MELEGRTLVIKRIHVRYRLVVDSGVDEEAVDRVHSFHAGHCPVARSLEGAIAITTEVELVRS